MEKILDLESNSVNNKIYDNYGNRWYEADDDPIALLRAESKTKTPWVLEKIKSRFPLDKKTHVLDIGCGAGFLSNPLAKAGLNVTGIDLSEESLKVAKDFDETNSIDYLAADAYKLPFPDQSFEVVTAMDFLEHVEDPKKVIEEVSRVLKPRGLFVFHTFNRNLLSYLIIIKFVEWFVKNTPKNLHVLRLFIKPQEVANFCDEFSMKVVEMSGIRPVFSSIPIQSLISGIVPKTLRFKLTKSLSLSYIGYAEKRRESP